MHACRQVDIDEVKRRREDTPNVLIRGKTFDDAARACETALDSATRELTDAQAYSAKLERPALRDAIDDALLASKRAREMLNIATRRSAT